MVKVIPNVQWITLITWCVGEISISKASEGWEIPVPAVIKQKGVT